MSKINKRELRSWRFDTFSRRGFPVRVATALRDGYVNCSNEDSVCLHLGCYSPLFVLLMDP